MQCPLNGQPCDNEKHIQLDGIKYATIAQLI